MVGSWGQNVTVVPVGESEAMVRVGPQLCVWVRAIFPVLLTNSVVCDGSCGFSSAERVEREREQVDVQLSENVGGWTPAEIHRRGCVIVNVLFSS